MNKIEFLRKRPWLLHLLLMLGISMVLFFLIFLFIRIYARQGDEYELPDIVGMNIAEVEADNALGFRYVVQDSIFRPGNPGGIILTQDPKCGTMVKKGRKVYISITAYDAEDAVLPELAGLTVRQAISELYNVGLAVGTLKFVEDPYKNNVIDQTCKGKAAYAGQQIPRGTPIDLIVGLGDGTGANTVPFVIGKTADKARRALLQLSFNIGREHFKGVKNRETAVVYRQEPDYTGVNKYPYGTSVELWYIDADDTDVSKMVSSFRVDSSKIVRSEDDYSDGRPTPDQIDEMDREW